MIYKYGEFSAKQIGEIKKDLRKNIFYLLLIIDKKTKSQFENVDVNKAIEAELIRLSGLNELLSYPKELVWISCLLQAAIKEYNNPDFNWHTYRKLILDAGAEVLKIKEV